MAEPFPLPSKKSVTKAGNILLGRLDGDKSTAHEIVSRWRLAHAIPMHTIGDFLRRHAKEYPQAIVARRLKRLPTILDKLERFPEMALHRMQDVGGVRVILKNVSDAYSLHEELINGKRFKHQVLLPPDDYIKEPKEDGYRGIHQVVRYHTDEHPELEGLQIEIQFRTKLQHAWATAVETYGILGRQSYKEWDIGSYNKRFFQLVSAAFARHEKKVTHPDFESMTDKELFDEIEQLNNDYSIIKKLQSTLIAAKNIHNSNKGDSDYQLLELDYSKRILSVITFTEAQLEDAENLYRDIEARNDPNVDVVLISVGALKKVKKAYPNYFLDGREFVKSYTKILLNQTD